MQSNGTSPSAAMSARQILAAEGPWALAAAGRFGSARALARSARRGELGPMGESMLHWLLLAGQPGLALGWIKAGGDPAAVDAGGSTAMHWAIASALSARSRWVAMARACPELLAALAPAAAVADGRGRDPMGLACLCRGGACVEILARTYPERAAAGVRLAEGLRLGLADAVLACGMATGSGPLAALMEGFAPPSLSLPAPLRALAGRWTPSLWEAAALARASDGQLARMEAIRVGRGVGRPTRSASARSRL